MLKNMTKENLKIRNYIFFELFFFFMFIQILLQLNFFIDLLHHLYYTRFPHGLPH